jgi:hypothetical protein
VAEVTSFAGRPPQCPLRRDTGRPDRSNLGHPVSATSEMTDCFPGVPRGTGWLHLPAVPGRQSPVLAILPTGADRTDGRSQSRSSSRVPVSGRLSRSRLACGHRRALTVILLGFNNDRAGRMAAHIQRRTALSWCGACSGSVPRRPPPCAAAVRRAAAGWCGGFIAGVTAPHSAVCASSRRRCVRGPAPPRRAARFARP